MDMKNKTCKRVTLQAVICLLYSLPLFFLPGCMQRQSSETARSGQLTLALDRQLKDIASTQAEMFTRYYPEARISLLPASSGKTLRHLFDSKAGAALISGESDAAEDSLFATLKRPLRLEPVARDAIVCIVNRRNLIEKLSLKELAALFSGKQMGVVPLITADDYRLQSLFAAKTGQKRTALKAWAYKSDEEVIARVADDSKAVALLFRSSLDAAENHALLKEKIRIIPLSRESKGTEAFQPTRQNIFDGLYPLVTTVYYVYYSGDALAAGFGSWLGSSGQKAIERSSLVPFRLLERTIILK